MPFWHPKSWASEADAVAHEAEGAAACRIQAAWRMRASRGVFVGMLRKARRRAHIANEIRSTERSYVQTLAIIVEEYKAPLSADKKVKPEDIKVLFSEIDVLLGYNRMFLADVEARIGEKWQYATQLGDVFLIIASFFKVYTAYVNNFMAATHRYNELMDKDKHFRETVAKLDAEQAAAGRGLRLLDLLIQPVQRIPRYRLLLTDLLGSTDQAHADFANLSAALEKVKEVAGYLNEKAREAEAAGAVVSVQHRLTRTHSRHSKALEKVSPNWQLLEPSRTLMLEAVLQEFSAGRKEWKPRRFFLFGGQNPLLLMTTCGDEKHNELEFRGRMMLHRNHWRCEPQDGSKLLLQSDEVVPLDSGQWHLQFENDGARGKWIQGMVRAELEDTEAMVRRTSSSATSVVEVDRATI